MGVKRMGMELGASAISKNPQVEATSLLESINTAPMKYNKTQLII